MSATMTWPTVKEVGELSALGLLGCDNAKRLCAVALRVQRAAYDRGTLDDMRHADAMVQNAFNQYARTSAQRL